MRVLIHIMPGGFESQQQVLDYGCDEAFFEDAGLRMVIKSEERIILIPWHRIDQVEVTQGDE